MKNEVSTWRESLIDIDDLKLHNLSINKVINYLPAGNDVFECIGKKNGKKVNFFLKSERSKYANIINEGKILPLLRNALPVPLVLDKGIINNHNFIVLSKLSGSRLSALLENNVSINKNKYLLKYGASLAHIHNIKISWKQAMQRTINDYPKEENYFKFDDWEIKVINYLYKNKPSINDNTFIHGDFHYANILWSREQISGILDWEYSGKGFKEQDIAWALILRPEQKFMDTQKDILMFLKGYQQYNRFDPASLKWCYINGMMHFYLMNKNGSNKEYIQTLKTIINEHLGISFFDNLNSLLKNI